MSSDLRENLKIILSEKVEKIIPENIKEGVTIFGVEGICGSGGNENTHNATMDGTYLVEASTLNFLPTITHLTNFDCSNITSLSSGFAGSKGMSNLKELTLVNTSQITNMYMAFYQQRNLEVLGEVDCSSVTTQSYCLNECFNLVSFGGLKDIGKAFTASTAINLQACKKLSHESVLNVLNKVYDLNLNSSAKGSSLAFGTVVFPTLTADEIAIGTAKRLDCKSVKGGI